jgi:hypothetical protein
MFEKLFAPNESLRITKVFKAAAGAAAAAVLLLLLSSLCAADTQISNVQRAVCPQ